MAGEQGNAEEGEEVKARPHDQDTTRKGIAVVRVLLTDSTVFSTLFGADDSLKQFWTNLATAKVIQHV